MDHSTHPRLGAEELTEAVLTGAPVYGPEDETVGTITHTHGSGPEMSVIIDVGGFLGIGAKPVQIAVRELDLMRDETGQVHGVTRWTKDELKALPEHHH
ncbi:MAG: PRC-barrel domain containing protein [Paracoccaceae bacterium]